jgi:hypothetical protein
MARMLSLARQVGLCLGLAMAFVPTAHSARPPEATVASTSSTVIEVEPSPEVVDALAEQKATARRLAGLEPDAWVAIFTAVLAVFTILLWRSTRGAARTAQEALTTIERAFVFIGGFDVELSTAADNPDLDVNRLPPEYQAHPELYITRLFIFPRWKNSGSTPTVEMKIRTNGGPAQFPADPNAARDPVLTYNYNPLNFTLGPGAVETSDGIFLTSARELVDWSFHPVGTEPLFLIFGRAEYQDVFGAQHLTEWCYKLRLERHAAGPMTAGFVQWGPHNRSI